LENS